MKLSAPTTITLRRPSADADHIISRHDDGVTRGNGTTRDVTDRQVSYSEPGSATASSPEEERGAPADCRGRRRRKEKSTEKGCGEERWRAGVRRVSDCLRDVVKRCQLQLQLCNDDKHKVRYDTGSFRRHLITHLSSPFSTQRHQRLRLEHAWICALYKLCNDNNNNTIRYDTTD